MADPTKLAQLKYTSGPIQGNKAWTPSSRPGTSMSSRGYGSGDGIDLDRSTLAPVAAVNATHATHDTNFSDFSAMYDPPAANRPASQASRRPSTTQSRPGTGRAMGNMSFGARTQIASPGYMSKDFIQTGAPDDKQISDVLSKLLSRFANDPTPEQQNVSSNYMNHFSRDPINNNNPPMPRGASRTQGGRPQSAVSNVSNPINFINVEKQQQLKAKRAKSAYGAREGGGGATLATSNVNMSFGGNIGGSFNTTRNGQMTKAQAKTQLMKSTLSPHQIRSALGPNSVPYHNNSLASKTKDLLRSTGKHSMGSRKIRAGEAPPKPPVRIPANVKEPFQRRTFYESVLHTDIRAISPTVLKSNCEHQALKPAVLNRRREKKPDGNAPFAMDPNDTRFSD
eukprot:GFYU01014173.1.p1 GENE.GFYU01014173.1~~GFYU01014173.1.p1  ORF type:complete len:396 (-),score=57.14 GFYU01014173.1:299-1486(-)